MDILHTLRTVSAVAVLALVPIGASIAATQPAAPEAFIPFVRHDGIRVRGARTIAPAIFGRPTTYMPDDAAEQTLRALISRGRTTA